MPFKRLLKLVAQNLLRNKKNLVFSSVGIVVGVTLFTFFLALSGGIKQRVLNRVYPINQIEIEPSTVTLAGFKRDVPQKGRLNNETIDTLSELDGVAHAYPKQRFSLPSLYRLSGLLVGGEHGFEGFFDGIEASLLWDELKEREGVVEKRKKFEGLAGPVCEEDGDCKPGFECRDGQCAVIEYWRHFQYRGQMLSCDRDDQCLPGELCIEQRCERTCDGDGACNASNERCRRISLERPTVCLATCTHDGDCVPGYGCVPADGCGDSWDCLGSRCEAGRCVLAGACRPIPCRLKKASDQQSDSCHVSRGELRIGCDPAEAGEQCPSRGCPSGTYCATSSQKSTNGVCELPIPVVVSPFLVEMYNSVFAPRLNKPRLDAKAWMGLGARMVHGASYITADMPKKSRMVKKVRLVGFSDKALDLGVTTPLEYVRRVNAHYRGQDAADRFDSVVLQTHRNENISKVTLEVEQNGFTLSRKSQDAKKAGTMLFILTGLFTFISAVILVIAAVNITHTFLMIVYERKHEIGIQRAIGANRWDIRKLILLEAASIGLVGGLFGNGLAFGFAALTNALSNAYLHGIPFKPDDLFVFSPTIVTGSIAFALLFCVLGAFFPANRAAKMDPAEVLSMK